MRGLIAWCFGAAFLVTGIGVSAAQTAAPPAAAGAPAADMQNANAPASDNAAAPPPLADAPGTTLTLRGLDKITGQPTQIVAPIGKPVQFATLTITARYCYSTPPSEPPETSAFLQIDDHRPGQKDNRIFSGWMYASSPGLNGLQHPLYDVWVISCSNGQTTSPVAAMSATQPIKVGSPDSSDKEKLEPLPKDAGR
jgi:hypothetical protein